MCRVFCDTLIARSARFLFTFRLPEDFHRFICSDVQSNLALKFRKDILETGANFTANLNLSGECMSFDNVPRCQHIKINGTQCGCPALRRRRLCFFHVRCQDQRKRIMSDQFKQARFVMPILEDANAVQMALMQIMQLLSLGQMDHKTAGLMLYALQTASVNLRNTRFEPRDVTDVVIDRDDVHRTSINGPQWFEEDF